MRTGCRWQINMRIGSRSWAGRQGPLAWGSKPSVKRLASEPDKLLKVANSRLYAASKTCVRSLGLAQLQCLQQHAASDVKAPYIHTSLPGAA